MSKRLKILFLNQTMGIGGAETLLNGLFTWLKENSVEVIQFSTNLKAYPQAKKIPVVVDFLGDWKGLVKGLLLLPIAFFYYGYLVYKNRRVNLVFLSGFSEKILGSIWAWIIGLPVVWIEHGPYGRLMTQFGGMAERLYLHVIGIPQVMIVPSCFTANWLTKKFPDLKKKVQIIPNAITPKSYSQVPSPYSVVCVSRLESGKGQDLLIQAWSQVLEEVPLAKLKIIGEGDQYTHLKSQILNLNLTSSVEVIGWVNDARREMAKAQVVVFPTVWPLEGFGMVAVEAVSVGRPVVGFDFGPLPEVVGQASGILVPPGDLKALAQAIVKLLKYPVKVKLDKKFTWPVAGRKYLSIFHSVC